MRTLKHIATYISNREECLLKVCNVAGVNRWCAKNSYIILLFGGSVSSWRIDINVSSDARIPAFVSDLEEEIKLLQARFFSNPTNTKYCDSATDTRRHNTKYDGGTLP